MRRLQDSGYPSTILFEVAESLITPHGRQKVRRDTNRRPAVLPYIHRISHNLKKIASKFHVQVVFSAPDTLKKLCPKINSNQQHEGKCRVHHQRKYVDCRCLRNTMFLWDSVCGWNRKVCERPSTITCPITEVVASRPPCHACKGLPVFRQTKILKRFGQKRARELYEAQVTMSSANLCLHKRAICGLVSKRTLFFLVATFEDLWPTVTVHFLSSSLFIFVFNAWFSVS